MKALRVVKSGPFTTVQDRGRFGYRQFGIPPCGMMDPWAGILANVLVGNEPDAAVLEWTFQGGRLEALDEFDIALTGGDMELQVNGIRRQSWASHRVHRGDDIELGEARDGCRAYLAVSGGIDVPLVMGSRSTHIAAKMGGYEGRTLAKEDLLSRGDATLLNGPRTLPEEWIPKYGKEVVLRAIAGPQESCFGRGVRIFFRKTFSVSPMSNRMGYRLQGPTVQRRRGGLQGIISEAILPGAVQIPEDGQPIVLFSEQTAGGYAKIATVISVDIPRLAQAIPGNEIRFEQVTLKEAHRIRREMKDKLRELTSSILKEGV